MADGEGGVDRDCAVGSVWRVASAEQGADDAVLVWWTAGGVVEDRENRLRLDDYIEWCGGGLGAHCSRTQRSRQVEERVRVRHAGQMEPGHSTGYFDSF